MCKAKAVSTHSGGMKEIPLVEAHFGLVLERETELGKTLFRVRFFVSNTAKQLEAKTRAPPNQDVLCQWRAGQ